MICAEVGGGKVLDVPLGFSVDAGGGSVLMSRTVRRAPDTFSRIGTIDRDTAALTICDFGPSGSATGCTTIPTSSEAWVDGPRGRDVGILVDRSLKSSAVEPGCATTKGPHSHMCEPFVLVVGAVFWFRT
jgi:hypothetical protein